MLLFSVHINLLLHQLFGNVDPQHLKQQMTLHKLFMLFRLSLLFLFVSRFVANNVIVLLVDLLVEPDAD